MVLLKFWSWHIIIVYLPRIKFVLQIINTLIIIKRYLIPGRLPESAENNSESLSLAYSVEKSQIRSTLAWELLIWVTVTHISNPHANIDLICGFST